jgi:hypothetical protein
MDTAVQKHYYGYGSVIDVRESLETVVFWDLKRKDAAV